MSAKLFKYYQNQTPFNEYAIKFLQVFKTSELNDAAGIAILETNVLEALVHKVSAIRPAPNTVVQWIALAKDLNQTWENINQARKGRNSRPPSRFNNNSSPPSSSISTWRKPTPTIQVKATNTNTRGKMTPEMRERFSREGRCFFCRELGHTSSTCPELKDKVARGILKSRAVPIEEIESPQVADQVFAEED